MAISTKHTFISVKADGPDSTVVQPSDWNADHTITLAAGKVIGRVSGTSGAAQELPLVFDSTLQSMIPPVGTTAQRPATPAAGMMRYNSNTAQLEMYRNSAWGAVGGNAFVGAAAPTNPQEGDFWYNSTSGQIQIYVAGAWVLSTTNLFANTFSGNGVQTVFVLTVDPGAKQNTMVYISGVYQEKSKYSVSGTSLTFVTAPANGSVIEVTLMSTTTIGVPNNGSVTTAKIADGAVTRAKLDPTTLLVVGAAVDTGTGGIAYDLTGIPAYARRVTVLFAGCSLSGNDHVLVQLGTSAGFVTIGYAGVSTGVNTGAAIAGSANGFVVFCGGPTTTVTGLMTLMKVAESDQWIQSHSASGNIQSVSGGGRVTLTGPLTQLRITRSGTDTFDSGKVSLAWE